MPLEFHSFIIVISPHVQIFHFFIKPFEIIGRVKKYDQFGLLYAKIVKMTLILYLSTAGYRGSHYDSRNSGMKFFTNIWKFSGSPSV